MTDDRYLHAGGVWLLLVTASGFLAWLIIIATAWRFVSWLKGAI